MGVNLEKVVMANPDNPKENRVKKKKRICNAGRRYPYFMMNSKHLMWPLLVTRMRFS